MPTLAEMVGASKKTITIAGQPVQVRDLRVSDWVAVEQEIGGISGAALAGNVLRVGTILLSRLLFDAGLMGLEESATQEDKEQYLSENLPFDDFMTACEALGIAKAKAAPQTAQAGQGNAPSPEPAGVEATPEPAPET